jgi:predicted Ser/Thr protein kinase
MNELEMKELHQWEINYEEIELGKELGKGAFGIVYKATWRNSDCVVKQMNFDSSNTAMLNDFLKEAQHMK